MRRIAPLLVAVYLLSSCTFAGVTITKSKPTKTPVPSQTPHVASLEVTGTNTPIPTIDPTDDDTDGPFRPERTNWLLLGGDFKAHRRGTGWGDKTDVIILVSVLDTDPMEITLIQYPRNLWIPINGMDDQWLYAVWGNEDYPGLHYYWQEAFDVPIHGIFYINMDGFVKLVDDLEGVCPVIGNECAWYDGEQALAWLRDNDNNWNYGSYDAGERALRMAQALANRVEPMIVNEPVVLAGILFDRWHGLVQSDVSELAQLAYLVSTGWRAKQFGYSVERIQLEEPMIIRGDTPLEVRGMIPNADLKEWHRLVLP